MPNKVEWPTHPDGRPMKLGEMTREQRREQARAACDRLAGSSEFMDTLRRVWLNTAPCSDRQQ